MIYFFNIDYFVIGVNDVKKIQIMATLCIGAVILSPLKIWAKPEVSARAAILTELTTGRIIYEKNIDEKLPMASTTKIMTAISAIEEAEGRLDEVTEVSDKAAGVEGSSMYLEKGEKMTLRELLYGLMLPSGNDAAVAVSEVVCGSEEKFVELMNKKASEMGLENTHFANPNGLPDENHYSTARDMAKMTEYAMKNSVFAEIAGTKSYKISGEGKAYPRTLTNHNKLLKAYDGCNGVKTGFTKAAGRCLVTSAERDGMTLICVTLNAPDDWRDHTALLDYGFANYKMVELCSADIPYTSVKVTNSYITDVPLYPQYGVRLPLMDGEDYAVSTEISDELEAPVKQGEEAGVLIYTSSDGKCIKVPLLTGREADAIPAVKKFGEKLAEYLVMIFSTWADMV